MNAVLEEHLGYLADSVRIDRFREALGRTIEPGDLIADIGCGFGVLGLLSLRAGAARVWGIDSSDAIEIARETMARAGLSDRYHCLREHSGRAILPEPVDVLVCDHVGYFGFDYGIAATLGDARRRLLKPGGRIVPGRIVLKLAAVESPPARAKADAWSGEAIPSEFHWLRDYGTNTKHAHSFQSGEVVTRDVTLGTMDLHQDTAPHLTFRPKLTANRDCLLDGLAGWFECELAEGVWMTNSPIEQGRIDRDQAFLPFETPIPLQAGESVEIALTIRHEDSIISWSVRPPGERRWRKQSTWSSLIIGPSCLGGKGHGPLHLGSIGKARLAVAAYVDGRRNAAEIEQLVLRDHPHLMPSPAETVRFVRTELARITT